MTFCLRLTFQGTGRVVEYRYATAFDRAMAIIGGGAWAYVETWEE